MIPSTATGRRGTTSLIHHFTGLRVAINTPFVARGGNIDSQTHFSHDAIHWWVKLAETLMCGRGDGGAVGVGWLGVHVGWCVGNRGKPASPMACRQIHFQLLVWQMWCIDGAGPSCWTHGELVWEVINDTCLRGNMLSCCKCNLESDLSKVALYPMHANEEH